MERGRQSTTLDSHLCEMLASTDEPHCRLGEASHGGTYSSPRNSTTFCSSRSAKDKNETPLSVLSTLARLDMDPWQEAGRLNQLSKEEAVNDINSALGALPGRRWTASEAVRLVGLLPSRNDDAYSLEDEQLGRRIAITTIAATILGFALFAMIALIV